ncbi:hypothetical protein PFISCL1PPCAC_15734, partial [Pristionchus fissidentatus]
SLHISPPSLSFFFILNRLLTMEMMDMDMTMDMGNSTMAPMKMDPMWMWFHTDVDDMILFHFWQIHDVPTMVYSCFIIIAAGIVLEFLKFVRHIADSKFQHKIGTSYFSKFFTLGHLIQTVLFGVQVLGPFLFIPPLSICMFVCLYTCLSLCMLVSLSVRPSVFLVVCLSVSSSPQSSSLQMIWGYLCMLVFMSFSVYLCVSLIIGIVIGFFFFGVRTSC